MLLLKYAFNNMVYNLRITMGNNLKLLKMLQILYWPMSYTANSFSKIVATSTISVS